MVVFCFLLEMVPVPMTAVRKSRRLASAVLYSCTDPERLAMTCWIGGAYDLAGLRGMMVRAWRGE